MRGLKLNKRNILIICVVIIVGWGMFSRYLASVDLYKRTEASAVPNVTTILAKTGAGAEEIVLPANIQAWHEAPLFARSSGYVKRWVTDIGAHVKAGDLIAEIETPEIDAQMHQVEADLLTAKANNQLAQTTSKRWVTLLKTNSVSKQETDEKIGDAKAKEALMEAASANYDRLKELESFKNIVAPFDGTVTARNVDDGSLINAGSSTTARELFHIAEVDKLRVYVQVPQTYAIAIKPGFEASVHFTEHPDKSYVAKLLDTAGALDPVTRTLLLEFKLDNEDGTLLSGGYAEMHINIPLTTSNIKLPVNVLLFRKDGLQVAVVRDNHVALRTITVARDFGNEVEVSSGIDVGDKIIENPSDSLAEGQQVNVITPVKDEPKQDKKS